MSAAAGRPSARGARARRRDHGPVAAMHAVEIADGDDRALRAPRGAACGAVTARRTAAAGVRAFGHRAAVLAAGAIVNSR